MCGVVVGDVCISNSEGDLAGGDHAYLFGRVGVAVEGGSGVGVGSKI